MTLMRFPQKSARLSNKPIETLRPLRRRSLGDKLQAIAGRSPRDLKVVEAVVDLILMRLRK